MDEAIGATDEVHGGDGSGLATGEQAEQCEASMGTLAGMLSPNLSPRSVLPTQTKLKRVGL